MDAVVAEYPSLLSKFAIMHSNKDYGTKNKNSVQKCSKKHSLPLQASLRFFTNVQVQFLCQNIDPKVCRISLELPQNVLQALPEMELMFEHPRLQIC